MRKICCWSFVLSLCLFWAGVAKADLYNNDFSTQARVNELVTDRYEPYGFQSVGGQLRITINANEGRPGEYESAFYNTQGRKRDVSAVPNWKVSACLEVNSDWFSADQSMRTDLWSRDSNPDENYAWYGVFGLTNVSLTGDPFDPDAVEATPYFRVWDVHAGGWQVLDYTSTHQFDTGMYCLGFDNEGRYFINDELVYDDYYTSDPGHNDLQTVFLQAYDFSSDPFGTKSNYSVYWDDLTVTPEPGSLVLLIIGGFVILILYRRH